MTGQPDVYHNVSEVLWKREAATSYHRILEMLQTQAILDDPTILEINTLFINTFNSNHSQDNFCLRTSTIHKKLNKRLTEIGQAETTTFISDEISSSQKRISEQLSFDTQDSLMTLLENDQTHINDGQITLADEPMEVFASRTDYIKTILRLFNDTDGLYVGEAENAFARGFNLDLVEKEIIINAKNNNWDIVDTVTQLLLSHQINQNPPSIQECEFIPTTSKQKNEEKSRTAIDQAFYLMGKTIASIALYSSPQVDQHIHYNPGDDPIKVFLQFSKEDISDLSIRAIRKVALAHCSHGLNSGELTAQLASSVRTTFPRALIASLNVRSGLVHAGAVTECMRQTDNFLKSNEDPQNFVQRILDNKTKLYGFGHRIHKTSKSDSIESLGKDPRVKWYINAAKEGFPDKIDVINQLISYAQAIRSARPDLGANTDFGAAVLFHCLELPPQVATGFFMAFRIPGLCARIVNELQIKSNSRRPPFPVVLPYPHLKR